MIVKEILELHKVWLSGKSGGVRANLSGADLSGLDLSYAELHKANLSYAVLAGANLSFADLSSADLLRADLFRANIVGANLAEASLNRAELKFANLRSANLSGAGVSHANLSHANLSGAIGLLDAATWLRKNTNHFEDGIVVYKRIGHTSFNLPDSWVVEPGRYLTEVVNPDRCSDCGCGVNVGTWKWCKERYRGADLWECLIEWHDLAGVVVPYNTDGKFRASRVKLVEKIS